MGVAPAILLLLLCHTIVGDYCGNAEEYVVPPAILDPAPYPEWAHYHW